MPRAETVLSPCVGVCRLDQVSRLCEGCQRTVQEIAHWPSADNAERLAIVRLASERRRALEAAGRVEGRG
jgi:predicted Fe-S protein YdhL (DUF1289 family)